jgi:hypothetical protein
MSDIYGHLFGMPFARYDPATQSWRTSLDTSLLDLEMSSLTLPRSGGMRSGQLFERPMLEPATDAHDSSSLPTPHAGLGERGRDGVILNPKGQQDLQHAIAHLLPTPTVNDMGAGKDPEKWQEWTQKMRDSHNNGNGHGKSLEQEAISLLPTPVADHSRGLQQKGTDYQSLPNAVIALTGDSTPKPSDDGKTPLDDQPLTQLSLDEPTNPD